ncbi:MULTISPECIES: DUF411 domain-containing protein [unclassified Pseudomonas]|uniref:DUF411 domain-containing protein n=1 Tax=unclassified Pseudomonas TaxID=196821 RepID=UPI0004D4014C|nr:MULTISPECIES: DUF411 domain-containing protein [unclassified Pseudomonas]KES20548.1 metal-binding protein [Pseudomonas sp. AAC]OHR96180.1 metal-binding protein [Pseudomonas sp. HMSC75E02]
MRRILLLAALLAGTAQAAEPLTIDVHRDVNCGCCKDWIKHLPANGFTVNDHVEADMSAVKTRLGVPYTMGSCHTGVIDGKFVEGHVPASEVLKLRERADLVGAAVPGMPMGSPGMEMGGRYDAYQVLGLGKDGKAVVLADYPGR